MPCVAKCDTMRYNPQKSAIQLMCENFPVLRFVFDRRKKASKTTPASVDLEIYFDRRHRKFIGTGVKLLPGQWDEKRHAVNRKDGLQINARLNELKKEQEEIFDEMYSQGVPYTYEGYMAFTRAGEEVKRPPSFIDFMRQRITERNLRPGTKRTHLVALEALRRFGRIKSFESLTAANIYAFDAFLRRENAGRVQTTIYSYHKRVKVYVNEAFKLSYIKDNPYDHFDENRGRPKPRKPLTAEELRMLRETKFRSYLDKARDMFVFCCYTGLSYADMMAFDYKRHVVKIDGMEYIDGNRIKTGTEFFTPLLKPAKDVLEKYDYELPGMAMQRYNDYLHVIEARLDLRKPLTSHVARHTFATTVCLANDIPIETVSRMLGHRHVTTTEIYAKIMKENVERHARRLEKIV